MVSTAWEDLAVGHIHHRARLHPAVTSATEVIDTSQTSAQCLNRLQVLGRSCLVTIAGNQVGQGENVGCNNGDSIVIQIPLPNREPLGDEFSLMSTGPVEGDGQDAIIDMPDAVQQDGGVEDPLPEVELPDYSDDGLHSPIDDSVIEVTDDPRDYRSSTVLFQLHFDSLHVRISDRDFEGNVCRVLHMASHDLQCVYPLARTPDDLLSSGTRGFIVQHRSDVPRGSSHQLVLVDVVFFSNAPVMDTEVDRTVRLLPRFLTRRTLFTTLGLQPFCERLRDYQCVMWHNDRGIQESSTAVLTMNHGDYIRLWIPPMTASCQTPTRFAARCLQRGHTVDEVSSLYLEASPDDHDVRFIPNSCPTMDRADAPMLLQLGARKISLFDHLEDGQTRPDPPTIEVDLRPARDAFHWLDERFILPVFDVRSAVGTEGHWHPASLDWVDLPWYTYEQPVSSVWIYFDGSYLPDHGMIGFAAAMFVELADGHWCFAGASSGQSASDPTGSYRAELFAASIAVQMAFDILKIQELLSSFPNVHFVFDSLTVGRQLEGTWGSHRATAHCHYNRSIIKLIETRFHIQCEYHFTPGHDDDPGNELVDVVARAAANGHFFHDWSAYFEHALRPTFVQACEWLWILFDSDWATLISKDALRMPARPTTTPTQDALMLPAPASFKSTEYEVNITAATGNVLSLKQRDDEATSCGTPSRMTSLLRQMDEADILVFGLQESRIRSDRHLHSDQYWLLQAPATPKGQGGVVFGLHKQKAYATALDGTKQYFSEKDAKVVWATSRCLIVKVSTLLLKGIFIVAHAPHSGEPLETIEDFWLTIAKHLAPTYCTWPVYLLADANSKVGSETSASIGDWQAETTSEKGRPFHDFLIQHQIWLPSTFEATQVGADAATWQHTSGHWSRIDYVGLPSSIAFARCEAWINHDVDVSLCREDHRVASVAFSFSATARDDFRDFPLHKLNEDAIDLQQLWQNPIGQIVLPEVDVHSHAQHLQQAIVESIGHRPRRGTVKPMKQTMSPGTWALVCEKRDWRNQLNLHQRHQRQTVLFLFFHAWRHCPVEDCLDVLDTWNMLALQIDAMICSMDRPIALALFHFRLLGRQVVVAARQDDCQFFEALLREPSEWLAPSQVRHLWSKLRRALPKFKQRKRGVNPRQRADLDEKFMPYFQQLEAGCDITAEQLLFKCHERQLRSPISQQHFSIADMPSIFELEDELRATQAHRSTGYDVVPSATFRSAAVPMATAHFGLLMKTWVWQHEAAGHKGGLLTVIPKRPNAVQPGHYRGIMLLPSYAKRVHSIVRKRVIQCLLRRKPAGQLGGMPQQQVMYGSHTLRTQCKLLDAHSLSTGVIFLDLATAFHKLLRELVTGPADPEDVATLIADLAQQGFNAADVRDTFEMDSVLERLQMPAHLASLLRDIHCQTWYSLGDPSRLAVTLKGTRPGSPLADAVFHLLMSDVLQEFSLWVQHQTDFVSLMEELEIPAEPIVWSDDIAIVWATRDCRQLPIMIRAIVEQWDAILSRRGFALNLARGKTSVVATFRGAGAPEMRQQFQFGADPGDDVMIRGQPARLCYVPHYKHLGTQFSSNHTLDIEINVRLGIAKATFAELSRAILLNRHLPCKLRLQMFQSLVCSRLFFGLGAWSTPNYRQLQRLKGTITRMVKRILHVKADAAIPVELIVRYRLTGLLEPRARLALDRLLYAHKLWANGPSFLQHLVMLEEMHVPNSWAAGLQADLTWLFDLETPLNPDWRADNLTELIAFWQDGGEGWRKFVKRAWKRYGFQEAMMIEAHQLHHAILKVFKDHGATFQGSTAAVTKPLAEGQGCFECECGREFTTAVGLATHKRQAHGVYSLERPLLQGNTCPACLL